MAASRKFVYVIVHDHKYGQALHARTSEGLAQRKANAIIDARVAAHWDVYERAALEGHRTFAARLRAFNKTESKFSDGYGVKLHRLSLLDADG